MDEGLRRWRNDVVLTCKMQIRGEWIVSDVPRGGHTLYHLQKSLCLLHLRMCLWSLRSEHTFQKCPGEYIRYLEGGGIPGDEVSLNVGVSYQDRNQISIDECCTVFGAICS